VFLEEKDKLIKIAPSLYKKLKNRFEINPASGSIQSQKEAIVQVRFSMQTSFRIYNLNQANKLIKLNLKKKERFIFSDNFHTEK
jgi:hypothetical protein